ncbi:MAG: zinc ribbon domain-containing protein [Candidatus Wallbacteria bacterium]|nr:zinc ribbon domain-containing protein [Candidatus Wallbacteria bacterium]
MPFYEYECEACDRRTEVFHGMNENPEVKCENCNGEVRRVIFPTSVIFKGSGFYATEYGKSKYNNPAKSASKDGEKKPAEAKSETTAKSETPAKAESTPAATCANDSGAAKKAA